MKAALAAKPLPSLAALGCDCSVGEAVCVSGYGEDVVMPPPALTSTSAASFCPNSGRWLMHGAPRPNHLQVIFSRDALGGEVWAPTRGAGVPGGHGCVAARSRARCMGRRVSDQLRPT